MKDYEARHRGLEILADCQVERPKAEKEMDRLLGRHPHSPARLLAHLRDAVDLKLEDPFEYADRKTQRGDAIRSEETASA